MHGCHLALLCGRAIPLVLHQLDMAKRVETLLDVGYDAPPFIEVMLSLSIDFWCVPPGNSQLLPVRFPYLRIVCRWTLYRCPLHCMLFSHRRFPLPGAGDPAVQYGSSRQRVIAHAVRRKSPAVLELAVVYTASAPKEKCPLISRSCGKIHTMP